MAQNPQPLDFRRLPEPVPSGALRPEIARLSVSEMPNAPEHNYPYQIAEAYDAMRETIGSGLRKQLEAPQQLPPEIASLLAVMTGHPSDGQAV